MSTETDLVKIREWLDTDEPEPADGWDWPAPPEYTEYRVEGQMRRDVLAKCGRPADDTCVVRLIQGIIEGGYSEYTVEHDYPIEVWIDEGRQSQKVFEADGYTSDGSLGAFLRWVTSCMTDPTTPAPHPTAPDVAAVVEGVLTEAEREAIFRAGDHSPELCDCSAYVIEQAFAEDDCCGGLLDTFAAVERILATRAEQITATLGARDAEVRAEVERLAAVEEAHGAEILAHADTKARLALERERGCRHVESPDTLWGRLRAAETRRDELATALSNEVAISVDLEARLAAIVRDVGALADEWAPGVWAIGNGYATAALRAVLAAHATPTANHAAERPQEPRSRPGSAGTGAGVTGAENGSEGRRSEETA